jgi:hypothetical protein
MNDYERYLKYKKRYIDLKNNSRNNKNQRGGAVNGNPLNDEIHFWGRQMMEHALFLYLGLEDGDHSLKKEAFNLCVKWKHFMHKNFYEKGIRVNIETIILSNEDLVKVDNMNIDRVNELITETGTFNKKIMGIMETGTWIGWIFYSMVEHMQGETDYFNRKINGPAYGVEEEIKYINEHHSTEIGATAQLIDPAPEQQKIIDIARSYAMKTMSELKSGSSLSGTDAANEKFPRRWSPDDEKILKGLDITDQATFLRLSIQFSQELTDFAKDTGDKIDSKPPQLKSVISPILAHHVHREFARFTETLNLLTDVNA